MLRARQISYCTWMQGRGGVVQDSFSRNQMPHDHFQQQIRRTRENQTSDTNTHPDEAIESHFGYLSYWTEEAGYLYKIEFDLDLWVLVGEGMKSWREVVLRGKLQHLSPQKTNKCTKMYGSSVRRYTRIFQVRVITQRSHHMWSSRKYL